MLKKYHSPVTEPPDINEDLLIKMVEEMFTNDTPQPTVININGMNDEQIKYIKEHFNIID